MKRFIPYPLLTAALFLMWVLLVQSVSPGQVALGILVSVYATWSMKQLRPPELKLYRIKPLLPLTLHVIYDILRSNLAVLKITLSPSRERVSGFVRVPLDLTNPHGLTVLAIIITATPGTMWIQYDKRRRSLLVHVFDLIEEDTWIDLIKNRYEAPLMQVFQS